MTVPNANLLTWDKFEIPSKKQIESSMFDLPLPFNPVIALNCGSNPETVVRVAYDLKPSITICLMYIFKQKGDHERKTSIGFSLDAWSLVLGAKTFPEGYALSGLF